jgi:ABC-2 type transport system permease protein
MYKLLSALRKETLILIRDAPGLLILFIMPVLLILVVVVAQENAVKSSRESKTEILFVDYSHSNGSKTIEQSLENSGFFKLIKENRNISLDEKAAMELISESKYPLGIVLSEKDTAIRILIDPTMQESYKNSLVGSLTYIIKGTQSRIAIESAFKTMAPGMEEVINGVIRSSIEKMADVKEVYPSRLNSILKPSLSQNSIPGFILFAMFFIVIPLSGSMITEKNEGSFRRLKTLPVPVYILLSSKVLLYLFVCLIQFLLMIMVGLWLLPGWFGYPSFHMGDQYFAIALTTLATGLAAIGFGLMVGAYSTTHGQAALFGSVMVVILGIISGAFLPIHLFPKFIQVISLVSPIRWGIENYLDLFIREGNLLTILPNILFLLLFFICAMMVSIYIFARQK